MTKKVNITTDSGTDAKFINLAVAARNKEQGKHLKLSLDALSKRAAISKGMLVEVEKASAPRRTSIFSSSGMAVISLLLFSVFI